MITKFQQFLEPILENKSIEHYVFLSKYFDIIFTLEEFLNNDNIHIVSIRNPKLIAVSLFRMSGDKIHMNYSVVEEKFRNKGLNTKIKFFIINFAKENGVTLITTNVRKSNEYSLKTFLNSGFEINNKYISNYPDGEIKIPLFLKL